MKLVHLELEGFMSFVQSHVLPLDQLGLVHIAGENVDDPGNNSNGSGKSTILEALTWCLFGEGLPRPQGNSEQGVRADEVLNDRTGKGCYVRVALQDGDEHHVVERWRKHRLPSATRKTSGACLTTNGDCDQALDEKETSRLICQRLGITRDIWCSGVVFGQEASFNFCEATAKQRNEILTTVMGLERIDGWIDKCRDEKRALTNKLAEAGGKVQVQTSTLERTKAEDPRDRLQQWDAERDTVLSGFDSQLLTCEAAGRQAAEALGAFPAFSEPEPTVVTVDALGQLRTQWHEAEEHRREAYGEVQRASAFAESGARQVSKVANMAQGQCPTCDQPITEEHRAKCLGAATGQHDQAQAVLADAQAAMAMTDASQQIKAQLDAAEKMHRDAGFAIAAWQRRKSEADEQVGTLRGNVEQHRAHWRHTKQKRDTKAVEINPYSEIIDQWHSKVERLDAELGVLLDQQKHFAHQLDIRLWWEKELPRFKTWLFDSIVDVLASEANRWLGIMSGGVIWIQITTQVQRGKRLKDELDVQIYRWQPDGSITSRPYRVWSGGEKRRVALAVDLGLSRLMAQRASKPYRFLALDEIDRHLDDRGKEGLRAVLAELRREKDTVLVATHDPEFRASFDSEIMVTKRQGQSSFVMEKTDGSSPTEQGSAEESRTQAEGSA